MTKIKCMYKHANVNGRGGSSSATADHRNLPTMHTICTKVHKDRESPMYKYMHAAAAAAAACLPHRGKLLQAILYTTILQPI